MSANGEHDALIDKDDEPNLRNIGLELEHAQTDANRYYQRMEHARHWWRSRWEGQTWDGRKHAVGEEEVFPWENASDSRLRTIGGLIREHVTVAKFAFWRAKIQARPIRPLVQGRVRNISQKMLEWRLYTHMKSELLRELPLALNWRFGYGCSFIWIEWEQERELHYVELSLQDLDQMAQQNGGDPIIVALLDSIMDESAQDNLATLIQSFSPILKKKDAIKIISDLRNLKTAKIPVASLKTNRPTWTACRPCVDVLFPREASDIQKERWVSRREWVSDTDLEDRIETDDYSEEFVAEAKKHKGEAGGEYLEEYWRHFPPYSYRDLIELQHFYFKWIENGVPIIYRTVFNVASINARPGGKQLYACHQPFEYEHGQYPLITMRRVCEDRDILSSMGIAEEAYTDEQNLKIQQDGLIDRTSLVLRPWMVVPFSRAQAIKRTPLPGSVIAVNRPNELKWGELPPSDRTPLEVTQMVMNRLDRRYALFGEVDPELKNMRRQEVAEDVLGEIELALGQTFALMQQYETDEEVQQIVGQRLPHSFNASREEIQGKHEITATIDMKMIGDEYFEQKFKAIVSVVQTFNQGGIARTNEIERALFEMIDPDLADIGLAQDDETVTQKEVADEKNAAAQILAGVEPDKPMLGNHQLRLQTLVGHTIQSPNPDVQQLLQSRPGSQAMLKNRIEFFQNRIQQTQVNPQIGRATSTATFNPKGAPQTKQLMEQ